MGETSDSTRRSRPGSGDWHRTQMEDRTQHGKPRAGGERVAHQLDAREGQAGPGGAAERPVVTGEAG